METLVISAAFILGVTGSLHCFGMCGPIAFALAIDRKQKSKMFFQNLSYQLGRIFSYTLLGLVFGAVGYGFSLARFQKLLSVILGMTIMISVFISDNFFTKIYHLNSYRRLLSKLRLVLGFFIKKKTFLGLFITGILNGILPCGLIYIALANAITNGKIFYGGVFMLFFGLGTLPLMFTTVILGNFIGIQFKKRISKFMLIIVFFVGTLILLRGLQLDIPYISPSKNTLYLHKIPPLNGEACHYQKHVVK